MFEKTGVKDTIFTKKRSLNLNGKLISIKQPWIMGILNLTPDSFFDGGKFEGETSAIKQSKLMLDEGANIIDLGASSSRPGAERISPSDEIERLKNPLKAVRKEFPEAILSVDTYHSEVAKAAADLGANMINDISGGMLDTKMPKTMGELKLPYILMHMKGSPDKMQHNPEYTDVYKEVASFFSKQIQKLLEHNVADIILDPGFGFGKELHHNYELLQNLELFELFERPLMVGFSRKSMINKVLGTQPNEALNGTTVLNTLALTKGADILRVHDVKEAVEAVKLVTFVQNHT